MKRCISILLVMVLIAIAMPRTSLAATHVELETPNDLLVEIRISQMVETFKQAPEYHVSDDQVVINTPASLNPASVCIASGCAGSICFASGCAGSICFGSGCISSACLGSGCASSACTGTVCVGSVCVGSACVASTCVGEQC